MFERFSSNQHTLNTCASGASASAFNIKYELFQSNIEIIAEPTYVSAMSARNGDSISNCGEKPRYNGQCIYCKKTGLKVADCWKKRSNEGGDSANRKNSGSSNGWNQSRNQYRSNKSANKLEVDSDEDRCCFSIAVENQILK